MLEWVLLGLCFIVLTLGVVAWVIYVYPRNIVRTLIEGLFFRKKEWWQDRIKRIEKENINDISKARMKAKKG